MARIFLAFLCCFLSVACSDKTNKPILIALNPWPGYEFLYLAEKKGFFEEHNLNIKLQQLSSLSDAQQTYIHGYVDGFTSTIVEAIQAQILSEHKLKVVLIPDYSNGGDVIISKQSIKNIADLKGKIIGAEVSSLGIYMLQKALEKNSLSLEDVTLKNIPQEAGEEALLNNEIDAFITYPPESIAILKHPNFHKIFSSTDIPNEILDVVSVSEEVLEQHPNFVSSLRKAWKMALDYYDENPDEALSIMAIREGITVKEFSSALNDIIIIDSAGQSAFFNDTTQLERSIKSVCEVLYKVGSIPNDCNKIENIVKHQQL